MFAGAVLALSLALAAGWTWWFARSRALDRWIGTYVREAARRRAPRPHEEVHVLLCIADHFEPKQNRPPAAISRARVQRWVADFPRQFGRFRDSDKRTPRHSFFYPIEEYQPEYLDALASLCQTGFGEVEIHLHHDNDSAENLRRALLEFKECLAKRHGLLSRRRDTGEVMYGFIHGNWALSNSRPDGRFCGVNDELAVLHETGCYADFTLPAAPSPCQTRMINRIYYAAGRPDRPRGHDTGVPIGTGQAPPRGVLLIQGPLMLDWQNRKRLLFPGVENGCLQGSQPPDIARLDLWLRARVQVPSRPDWFFVKLHSHGAWEAPGNIDALLGQPMVRFHEALAERARANPRFHFHYVTAREMYNLAKAAEAGWTGTVAEALDFQLVSNLQSATVVC